MTTRERRTSQASTLAKLSAARRASTMSPPVGLPYFARAVFSLVPIEMPGLREKHGVDFTVTENCLFGYDPAAVDEQDASQLAVTLLHNSLHVLKKHALRSRLAGVMPGNEDLWNLAADAEIFDDLVEAGLKILPSDPTSSSLGLPSNLAAEKMFEILVEKRQKEQEQQGGNKPCPRNGENGCGSGAGAPSGAEKDLQEKAQAESDERARQEHEASGADGDPPSGDDPGRDPSEVDDAVRQVAAAIQEAASKTPGKVPERLAAWANAVLLRPKIRWETQLARAIRKGAADASGRTTRTWSKPYRRQYAFEVLRPGLIGEKIRLAVVRDTSGSMLGLEDSVAAETFRLAELIGAEMLIVDADCRVQSVKKAGEGSRMRNNVRASFAGGGTSFVPAFDAFAKLKQEERPSVIVYVTDGCGEAPRLPPSWPCMTIWALVGRHRQQPSFPGTPWGKFVEVQDD